MEIGGDDPAISSKEFQRGVVDQYLKPLNAHRAGRVVCPSLRFTIVCMTISSYRHQDIVKSRHRIRIVCGFHGPGAGVRRDDYPRSPCPPSALTVR